MFLLLTKSMQFVVKEGSCICIIWVVNVSCNTLAFGFTIFIKKAFVWEIITFNIESCGAYVNTDKLSAKLNNS